VSGVGGIDAAARFAARVVRAARFRAGRSGSIRCALDE